MNNKSPDISETLTFEEQLFIKMYRSFDEDERRKIDHKIEHAYMSEHVTRR